MGQCAFLSLGSNIEPRFDFLSQAIAHVRQMPQSRVAQISPVYETEPVNTPAPAADPRFLNCVVRVETELAPEALLCATQAIETLLKRRRSVYGAPRTLDIDIICLGAVCMQTPRLVLPHPRAHLRRFVLQPLADLCPELVLPGFSRCVAALLRNVTDPAAVQRFEEQFN